MRLFRRALQTIQANRRPYLALNVILYGSFLVGFGTGLLFPGLTAEQTESLEGGGTADLVLAPVDRDGWLVLIPHSLTVVMEVQAYVLLSLGVYLLGRAWIWPRTVGAENRRQAYGRGLRQLGVLSLPALALLVVFALYESFSVVYLVPLLTAG